MNLRQGLLCVTLLAALSAHAMDGSITKEEFDQIVVNPFKATSAKNGTVVEVHLKADGSVVARQGYNDVGTWRRDGDAGYCVRWNKQRFDDRCSTFVKREGKLALNSPTGELTWWVEPLPK